MPCAGDNWMSLQIVALFISSIVPLFNDANACILLLEGATLPRISDKVQKAKLVVSATVLRKFEPTYDSRPTYAAELQVLDVYKGKKLFSSYAKSQGKSIKGKRAIFNATNFGPTKDCFNDVQVNSTYFIYFKFYDGRLSAYYGGIFGAVDQYIREKADEIQHALGWDPWMPWESCSQACGGGAQMRRRRCTIKNFNDTCDGKSDCPKSSRRSRGSLCEGPRKQKRHCNVFPCEETQDVLSTIRSAEPLPDGIQPFIERPRTVTLMNPTSACVPVDDVFPGLESLPTKFSIIMSFRQTQYGEGTLAQVRSVIDKKRVVMKIYTMENGVLSVVIMDEVYHFSLGLSSDEWHWLTISVRKHKIIVRVDCSERRSQPLIRTQDTSIADLEFCLGDGYRSFKGELGQLVTSTKPSLASKQCFKKGFHYVPYFPHSDLDFAANDGEVDDEDDDGYGSGGELGVWGEWSHCTTTCGNGFRSRVKQCPNGLPVAGCGDGEPRYQNIPCSLGECTGECVPACTNGGTCLDGDCQCPVGYNGMVCQEVICEPGCLNGGICETPHVCTCQPRFTGLSCEHEIDLHVPTVTSPTTRSCDPPCTNRGTCVEEQCYCEDGFGGPSCELALCVPECENGGSCVDGFCHCPRPYSGSFCQEAPCVPECQNEGRCLGGRCVCQHGFYGELCEHERCYPDCENGGRCSSGQCDCPRGFFGDTCQHRRCEPECRNGGSCHQGRCYCPGGWTSDDCSRPICETPCMNGGTCSAPNVCTCPPGFVLPHCAEKPCEAPCENGGTCVGGRCQCPPSFSGPACQQVVCEPDCVNGGLCYKGQCLCPQGWHGSHCNKPLCMNGCRNGGTCVSPGVCQCQEGFRGTACQIPISNCMPPCENGGKCGADGRRCACPQGYTGSTCESPTCTTGCVHGTCQAPNRCQCSPGAYGSLCEHFSCDNKCENGRCIGPNQCQCHEGFTGPRCERKMCPLGCINGGRCSSNLKCQCRQGYRGWRCQQRSCQYREVMQPQVRCSIQVDYVTQYQACGPWGNQVCAFARPVYKQVYKTEYEPTFVCM